MSLACLPSIAIEPLVGRRNPAIIRRIVVLPQPLGPRSDRIWPDGDLHRHRFDDVDVTEALAYAIEAERNSGIRGIARAQGRVAFHVPG